VTPLVVNVAASSLVSSGEDIIVDSVGSYFVDTVQSCSSMGLTWG